MRCEHGKEIRVFHRYADRDDRTPLSGFEVMVFGCRECEPVSFIDEDQNGCVRDAPVVEAGPDNERWEWLP